LLTLFYPDQQVWTVRFDLLLMTLYFTGYLLISLFSMDALIRAIDVDLSAASSSVLTTEQICFRKALVSLFLARRQNSLFNSVLVGSFGVLGMGWDWMTSKLAWYTVVATLLGVLSIPTQFTSLDPHGLNTAIDKVKADMAATGRASVTLRSQDRAKLAFAAGPVSVTPHHGQPPPPPPLALSGGSAAAVPGLGNGHAAGETELVGGSVAGTAATAATAIVDVGGGPASPKALTALSRAGTADADTAAVAAAQPIPPSQSAAAHIVIGVGMSGPSSDQRP
jgi:hypothetical protein